MMTSAIEWQFQGAKWALLRTLRLGVGAFGVRRGSRIASRALPVMDDHLLKDIGVSRQEIDLGLLQPTDGRA